MTDYTPKMLAPKLGTDARTLRRFLRDHPIFREGRPGSGKRWAFTDADIEKIAVEFQDWRTRPRKSNSDSLIDDAPGLSHTDAKDPRRVREISKARVDRLEAALKARGLHISQMRERDYTGRTALATG